MITKELLRQTRKALGANQTEMALKLCCSVSHYRHIEEGFRPIVDREFIEETLIDELRAHQSRCEFLKIQIAKKD